MPPGSVGPEGSLDYGPSNLKDFVKAQILLAITCPHNSFQLKLHLKGMTTLSRPSVTLEISWEIWV